MFRIQFKPALKLTIVFLMAASAPFLILTIIQPAKIVDTGPTLEDKIDRLVLKLHVVENRFEEFLRTYERNISVASAITSVHAQPVSPMQARALTELQAFLKWKNLVSKDINSTSDSSIFENRNDSHKTSLVSSIVCPQTYDVLILVTSHVTNFERRNVIRSTWGNDMRGKKTRWKTYFLLGNSRKKEEIHSLASELFAYGDIILTDTYEDFYNLTYKVQMGFEWSLKYCDFRYLLKGDDDVFVNMPELFNFLSAKETPKEELYAGNVNFAAPVMRTGKYGVSEQEYQKKFYPRYCSGGGFVVTRDLISKFIDHFDDVQYLKIDDAYVGELALKSGVDIHHDDNFLMFEDEAKCEYKEKAIVAHPVKSESCMEYLFKKMMYNQIKAGKFVTAD